MQKPFEQWIFMVQGKSKATDIKWFTYTFIQAQKSLSAMTCKPSRIDGGHLLFTKIIVMLKIRMYLQEQTLHYQPWATAALVQLGEQTLLPSQALCTVSSGYAFHSFTFTIPLGHIEVESHWRQWNFTSLWWLNIISKYFLWKQARVENVFFPLVFTTPSSK